MSTQTVVTTGSSSSIPQNASDKPHPTISLHVELAGGLELLWKGVRSHKVELPVPTESNKATCGNLIAHLATTHLATHPQRSMFVLDEEYVAATKQNSQSMTVRPGILVMVNEADWALEGEEECGLAAGDEVVFVSTLHGG